MNLRNIIILTLFSALLVAFMVLFTRKGMVAGAESPYKAIPTDAVIILENPDLPAFTGKLTGRSGLFRDMYGVSDLNRFYSDLAAFDSLLNVRETKSLLSFGNSVISFHVIGKGKPVPLLSATVAPEIRHRHLRDLISSAGDLQSTSSEYQGYNIKEVSFEKGEEKRSLFFALCPGLLLCSPSRVLLESALRHYDEGSDIRDDNSFTRILGTAGKNEDRIFVLFRNMPRLLSEITSGRGNTIATSAGRVAGSGGGDILVRNGGLIISGYIDCQESSHLLNRYLKAPPISFNYQRVLPSSIAMYETASLGVFPKYGSEIRNRSVVSLIASQAAPFLASEVTKAWLDIRDRPAEENLVLLYEISNSTHLQEATNNIIRESSSPTDESILWFSPDNENRIAVYKLPAAGLHKMLVPGFAPDDFNDIFLTFYDNFIITGSSYTTVTRVLYDNMLNRTLINDLSYREFRKTLPSRAVYSFYAVPHKATGIVVRYLGSRQAATIQKNSEVLRKLGGIGYQFNPGNNMLYHSLSITLVDEVREETLSEWETLLDTTATSKPFFFTNHNTGAREIFVQDRNNNIYLINSAGRVLWKAPVREPINGPVYMIDYYRNGRLQLLFAGREYLHLLDRNGNYVDRYPVKMRSPATSPLSLFDYDNNRDYRLVIAGEDRQIHMYDKSGNVVRGWTPFRTATEIRSEIKHFRVESRDYIVAADETGIYFLDRRGTVRVTVNEPVRKAVNSEMRVTMGRDPAIVLTAPSGEVQLISFNGNVTRMKFEEFSSLHHFDYFDINGNGAGEFLFIDKGKLYIYGSNGRRLVTKDFKTEDLSAPIGFLFPGNERGIGVVDNRNKLIYVVDKDGTLFGGFPLRGASLFSIGRLTGSPEYNLIVAGTDNFLYNYIVRR